MTVQELIDELMKIKDKSKPVELADHFETYGEAERVIDYACSVEIEI